MSRMEALQVLHDQRRVRRVRGELARIAQGRQVRRHGRAVEGHPDDPRGRDSDRAGGLHDRRRQGASTRGSKIRPAMRPSQRLFLLILLLGGHPRVAESRRCTACRSGATPSKRRHRLRRRPGLRRHRPLQHADGRRAPAHAEPRPDGRRGRPPHQLLRRAGGLLGVAHGAADRRYPNRVGIQGALDHTATVRHQPGRDDDRRSAEAARLRDGDLRQVAPRPPASRSCRAHGFDEYFGLPYSNDMWPQAPAAEGLLSRPAAHRERCRRQARSRSVAADDVVHRARGELHRAEREKPFFLYVPHAMPHVPLFVSDKFKGKTTGGLYGDVIAEIDWSVGQILEALKRTASTTTRSSSSPPTTARGCPTATTPARRPLREGKGRRSRAACACRSSRAGRGTSRRARSRSAGDDDRPAADARGAGRRAGSRPNASIDGRDIWPLLAGERGAKAPHEALYFYWGAELHAVRSGNWKLHLPHPYQSLEAAGNDGIPGKYVRKEIELSLFDLEKDPAESTNVSAANPEVVKKLMEYVERAREDLGDSLTKRSARTSGRRAECEVSPVVCAAQFAETRITCPR